MTVRALPVPQATHGRRIAIGGPDVDRVCSLSDGVSGGALLAVAATGMNYSSDDW